MGQLSLSIVISTASLLIAGLTAWLTLFRRGTVKMTQPTVVFFGPDGGPSKKGEGLPKVFLRTLLFSTGKRGRVVESMFVRVVRGESVQNFNVWVYGDDRLSRGSGIFVGDSGLVCNHHFLLPRDGTPYEFLPGDYTVHVFASLLGQQSPLHLSSVALSLSVEQAATMKENRFGCYFDWGPDSQKYHGHVDAPPTPRDSDFQRLFA